MGVIQRQGIKHSIVNFTGLAIGTASTLIIYTQRDAVEAYGLVQFLLSVGIIGFPLFGLSANTVAIRFFPQFHDKSNGHNGFLPLLMGMVLAGWGFFTLIAILAWGPVRQRLAGSDPLLQEYLWMALPLSVLYTASMVLSLYASNFKRIVIPSILVDFSLKIVLPCLIVAFWLKWLPLNTVIWLLVAHYSLVLFGMVLYLKQLGEWHWRPNLAFLTPERKREIAGYAGFGVINGLSILLATKADTLMVGTLASIKGAGIYAISLNIAAAIEIPTKSLFVASASFVARYLADENWTELRALYQKVSINLLVAGFLLFGCIWVSANDLYAILPNKVEIGQGKYVLFFLCIAKLVDMGAGLNNQLVYYSKYYRYSMAALIVLAAANIGFNLWLIPRLGLTGAAVATLLSVFCYNLFTLILVWKKFRMQPFSGKTLTVAALAAASLLLAWFLPATAYHLLNILLRSGVFAVLFGLLVLLFRVSPDVNGLWQNLLKRLGVPGIFTGKKQA